ncbi:snRNA-activating protein complex subunit 2 isoform X2 [Cyprinodon tularosa]|uniref:snRNA-activating protein complex subunit 2 isoform X2 n=1 Tax=Cyprinodon tularosa TaxID=77115 RepID=UPI0018E286F4|nr:snRNA-activating protein complex subunit 2 isoform X2 [Cyprinodon tularosa]
MKPPPRARTKRDLEIRSGTPEPRRKPAVRRWGRVELKKLLEALKELQQGPGAPRDIDYVILKNRVPTRSISEVRAMVDSLKGRVMSSARFQLRMKQREEQRAWRPIQWWTHTASVLSGTMETLISAAFSQMLTVSSIEPCALSGFDPCWDRRPPAGRGVPIRPRPRSPLKAAACRGLPAPSKTPPAVKQTSPAAAVSSPPTGHPQPASASPPFPASSPSSSDSSAPLSDAAAKRPAKSRPTRKRAAAESRRSALEYVVDFEKIYKFLSFLQNPSDVSHLTPMESAVVLDLLMSLPEELPHLDCRKLQAHLVQMHQALWAPADSRSAKQLLSMLKDTQAPAAPDPDPARSPAPGTAGPDGDPGGSRFCPPLNPFLVPLNLLQRRQTSSSNVLPSASVNDVET